MDVKELEMFGSANKPERQVMKVSFGTQVHIVEPFQNNRASVTILDNTDANEAAGMITILVLDGYWVKKKCIQQLYRYQ
jgi:hypothetical protein